MAEWTECPFFGDKEAYAAFKLELERQGGSMPVIEWNAWEKLIYPKIERQWGGKREGAGRKPIAGRTTKKASVTLWDDEWTFVYKSSNSLSHFVQLAVSFLKSHQ